MGPCTTLPSVCTDQQCNAPPKVMNVNEAGQVKYDNCNAAFFVYSYQHFLDMVNGAIKNVCHQAGLDSTVPEIVFDPDTQRIEVSYPENFRQDLGEFDELFFSSNLNEYVGKGFRCNWTKIGALFVFSHWVKGNVTYIQQEYSTVIHGTSAMPSSSHPAVFLCNQSTTQFTTQMETLCTSTVTTLSTQT